MEGSSNRGGKRRLCLNCDNRHGCRTGQPICLGLEPEPDERYLSGRQLMTRRGLLPRCRRCGHFRQCWSTDKYYKALRPALK